MESDKFVDIKPEEKTSYVITNEGIINMNNGCPEYRLLKLIPEEGAKKSDLLEPFINEIRPKFAEFISDVD